MESVNEILEKIGEDKFQNLSTTSLKFKRDVWDFFQNFKDKNALELGTHKGQTSRLMSYLFKQVYTVNRLDNIDSQSDFYPNTEYVPSTEPEGDNNSAIYITKSVQLENPATALRVFFAGNKVDTSEIKVLFKILRTDDTSSLDELGYTFFNDTGLPDVIPQNSLGRDDLQEYSFSAGIKDDGIGDGLTSSSVFGKRVQDREVSLDVPDVVSVLPVFES